MNTDIHRHFVTPPDSVRWGTSTLLLTLPMHSNAPFPGAFFYGGKNGCQSCKICFCAACHLCPEPGDLSGNARVGLEDAILALQVAAGLATATDALCPVAQVDADGNGRVGLAEVAYVLQRLGGHR